MSRDDELLSEKDLAEEWHVPAGTLRQWRYLGRGPRYVRIGRHIRYRRGDTQAWLASQTVTPDVA